MVKEIEWKKSKTVTSNMLGCSLFCHIHQKFVNINCQTYILNNKFLIRPEISSANRKLIKLKASEEVS